MEPRKTTFQFRQPDEDEGLADEQTSQRVRAALDHPVAAVLTVHSLPVDIRHNTKIDRTAVSNWAADVLSGGRAKVPW